MFLALWPDPACRRALGTLAQACAAGSGGRAVPPGRIHATLAFLGPLHADGFDRVLRVVECAPQEGFPVRLTALAWRARQHMVWATGTSAPALERLVAWLNDALAAAELPVDRRGFRLHLTLVRGARRRPGQTLETPLSWPVEALTVMVSRPSPAGVHYQRLGLRRLG